MEPAVRPESEPEPDPEAVPSEQDADLVARARNGEALAFAALHERYKGPVYAAILARVPHAVARDLVQDTFLAALERLGQLQQAGAFGGWLLRIARNRATDWQRTRRNVVELPEMGRPAPPKAEAQQVLDTICGLPEAYREPLLLRLVQGMTGPEIAERLGMTPGSVRVNLHRGMKLLRAELGVEEGR